MSKHLFLRLQWYVTFSKAKWESFFFLSGSTSFYCKPHKQLQNDFFSVTFQTLLWICHFNFLIFLKGWLLIGFVFVFQKAYPQSDKEENELVMASLRTLYEKKQSKHQHSVTQKSEEVTFTNTNTPAYIGIILRTILLSIIVLIDNSWWRCVRKQLQPLWRHSTTAAASRILGSWRAEPSALSPSPWRGYGRY